MQGVAIKPGSSEACLGPKPGTANFYQNGDDSSGALPIKQSISGDSRVRMV